MKPRVVLAFLIFALSTSAWAGVRNGVAAFERGDYATAMQELTSPAKTGDAAAQYYIGAMYESGFGVEQDYLEATTWYAKSGENGHARAQFHLGLLYESGAGVKRNYAKAAKWYLLAAEQGHPPAQGNLGRLYLEGLGVAADAVEAFVWSSVAAGRGYMIARKYRELASRKLSQQNVSIAQSLARARAETFDR